MGFHIRDRSRVDSGFGYRCLNHISLCHGMGNGYSAHGADVIDSTPLDNRIDPVPVPNGCTEGFQQNGPYSLSRDITVPALAERPAIPVTSMHITVAEIFIRMQRQVYSACQGYLALPVPDAFVRQMYSCQ
ncbi:hypothetical protein D3C87_856550 [compost metagenome]